MRPLCRLGLYGQTMLINKSITTLTNLNDK